MRIKDWFTVPEGKSVTEKVFGRVLLSSVCSILLCMVCLASTTWAWFSVSLENTGNEIQIAAATVEVKVNDATVDADGGIRDLPAGTHTVAVKLASYDGRNPVYVVLAVKSSASEGTENTELNYYWIQAEPEETKKTLTTDKTADISYALSWVEPNGANPMVSVEVEEATDDEQPPEEEELVEDTEGAEEGQPSDGDAGVVDTPNDGNVTGPDGDSNGTTGEGSGEGSVGNGDGGSGEDPAGGTNGEADEKTDETTGDGSGGAAGGEPEVTPDVENGGEIGDAVGDNTGADLNDVSGTGTSNESNQETTQTPVPETSTDTLVDTPVVTPAEPSADPQTETVPEENNTSE